MSHKKPISLITATLLVVANCIGTGIFTTTGFLLRDLASPWLVFLVWMMGAGYSLAGVACYQKLHQLYPGSGGEYHFLSEGWHVLLGRFAGWVSLVAGFSAPIASSAMAFSLYLNHAFAWEVPTLPIAIGIIVLITLAQLFSLERFLQVHNGFVMGKLVGIFALILFCMATVDWQIPPLNLPWTALPFSQMAYGFFWCAFAFSGWNAVYYVASEVMDDRHQVFKASWLGTIGVAVLYLIINALLLFTVGVQQLSGQAEVVGVFLNNLFGTTAGQWLSFLIAFGLISTTSALFITGPRVYVRMAQDGALPKLFQAPLGQTPVASVLLQAGISIFILLSFHFERILHWTGFVLTLCSALAVSVLLRKLSFRTPIFWLALLFCLITFSLAGLGFPH